MGNAELRPARNLRDSLLLDANDPGKSRPALQDLAQEIQRPRRTGGLNFDTSVRKVPGEPGEVERPGLFDDEITVPDTLDPSVHQVSPRPGRHADVGRCVIHRPRFPPSVGSLATANRIAPWSKRTSRCLTGGGRP